MSEHQRANFDYQTTVATVLSVARRAVTIFDKSSEPDRKRIFLDYILQNPVLNGKQLTFELKTPFNYILELASETTKTTSLATTRPSWQGR